MLYQTGDQDKWKMSFVLPSKYGANLPLPKDSSVTIREVSRKIVAVVSFSGMLLPQCFVYSLYTNSI
jgi:hypothetical protein